LFMALTRSLVRSSLDLSGTLAESVTRANRLICADSTLSMPVTLFTFQLCLKTGVLSYVNAGHNPPIYFRAKEEQFIDLTRTGIFLGFDEEAHYEEVPISMEAGDFVVCYTDGVLDAINAKGEAYEMDRFQKKIAENKNLSAYDLLAEIEKSVHDFIGEAQLYDDLTVLIVRRS
jgi:sigma-B regulation protein RsbU (phosphoserine phosphatase)